MYKEFFGLKEKPFEITADPRFLYLSESHKEALAHLLYAVQEKKGFAVITGEVGTGKTTLVQAMFGRLDGSTRTAYLFNPKLESNNDFLYSICQDLEIPGEKGSKADYLNRLNGFLMDCYTKDVNVVLIVDEAQALSPQLLEEVRLLTNLETPERKLLQVILVGQPELNNTLEQPQFRPLKQRISVRFHLQPLNPRELKEYIKRRLRVAGARSPYLFSPKALKRIYQYSRGIPRLINIVCDNALINGYASEQRVIGDDIIQEVVSDLEGTSLGKKRKIIFFAAGAGVLIILLGVWYFWGTDLWGTVRVLSEETWQQARVWLRELMQKLSSL